jgi:hypothetical protein
MLPGFRFLVAAIVLSMSLLIFGLGAAALLRAAHEEFASNPSWRTTPEVTFAQQPAEPTKTVLAALRLELPAAATPQDIAPATAAPTEETAAAPALSSTDSTEPIAAQQPEEEASLTQAASPQAPTTEIQLAENAPAAEPAPVSAEKPGPAEEVQIASVATSKISASAEPQAFAASEQIEAPTEPTADSVMTKIATLGGPAVNVESPVNAKVSAPKADAKKTDQSAVNKRAQAKQANRRKIAAARAKLAALQAQQQQLLQTGPFLQQPLPAQQPQTTRRRRPAQQSLATQQQPPTTAH